MVQLKARAGRDPKELGVLDMDTHLKDEQLKQKYVSIMFDILAPGYAYWFGALDTGARTYHRVALEPVGGTLVLDLAGVDAGAGEATILLHDGGFTWPGMLTQWSSMNGMASPGPSSRLTVPQMGTGTYALCRVSAAEKMAPAAYAAAGGARSRCASGVLVPSGTLALSVPPA